MKKKKNPIYGDSLKVGRNDSLFFCAFSQNSDFNAILQELQLSPDFIMMGVYDFHSLFFAFHSINNSSARYSSLKQCMSPIPSRPSHPSSHGFSASLDTS
ncbi:hypothetical protein [Bacteroides caecimuris]|uniref:hypothetical protein n=1 Tax=Bacteroides caecimuris TaxID=1796613 RepID=UPI00263BE149|nr:hypothetical protein [Bacteroides caecimuris]